MNGVAGGRGESFMSGAMATKYPSTNFEYPTAQVQPTIGFSPTSVFDEKQVRGSSNGLSTADYDRKRVGGGAAPSPNGSATTTYDSRLWIDKNPARTFGG